MIRRNKPGMDKTRGSVKFILPPYEKYAPAARHEDPLPYYYKPVIGRLYRKRIQMGLDLLQPPYKRVLDFGYGSGLLFNTLKDIADEIHGIDLLSDADQLTTILQCQNISAKLKKGDILKADYPAGSFDLITAFSVFEHISDFEHILLEMHRILEPDGELLIGMPSVNPAMSQLFRCIGFGNINDYHVTRPQSVRTVAARHFHLVESRRLPMPAPECCALYFTFLLRKISGIGY